MNFNNKGENIHIEREEDEKEFPYTIVPWSKFDEMTSDICCFVRLCGIESERTYRNARSRLTDLGLIRAEDNGLILPYFEHGVAEDVLARIDDIKRRNNDFRNTSASTKRFRSAIAKRQGKC